MGLSPRTDTVHRNRRHSVLARDYHGARYQVFAQTNVIVQFYVDKPCPVLDAFMDSQAIEYGVLISAHNPHGLEQPAINNTIAHHQLTALLKSEFWEFFPARITQPDAPGISEPGVFILSMDLSEGWDLAHRFAQDSFVQIVKGHPPALIWPENIALN